VQDERVVGLDLDQLGEVLHGLLHVDVRMPRRVEDPEAVVQPHVDARRLDGVVVERVDHQPSGRDRLPQTTVGQDHLCTPTTKAARRAFCHDLVAPAQTARLESPLLRA
jgi:hypothetical protein